MATEAHARWIADNVRPADRAELWASGRSDPFEAMLRGISRTGTTYVALCNGRPAAMFGATPWSAMGGKAAVWMIGSTVLDEHGAQRALLSTSAPMIDAMQEQFPDLLYNFVDARNHKALRWLRWLGFGFGEPVPYGPDGLPFLPFYRRKREAISSPMENANV